MRLLTVPFHADETPMSWVSRLAARNGVKARRLCGDLGMDFQAVVDGDGDTLRKAAALGRIDPGLLQANAFRKTAHLTWVHRGETLPVNIVRRERIAVCPRCALADIAAGPGLRPQIAMYGRTAWLLDAVKTCAVHRIPLVLASEAMGNQYLHDFTTHVEGVVPRLRELVASAPMQEPSALETYVLARLDGKTASPLLDAMPLAAVLRLCETAGAVATLGRGADFDGLSDDDWRKAGGHGYEALAEGVDGLLALLDRLMDTVGPRDRRDGPRVAFRRLYSLLHATVRQPEFDAVRDIVREYIVGKFTFKEGDNVLGKPVGKRTLHSLHTLAKETSIHPKRLRKHLRAAGLVTAAQARMSDHNVLVDAGQAVRAAAQLAGTLSLMEATAHLNATRSQIGVLIRAGFVRPQRSVTRFGAQDRYAIADLDTFLARLGGNPRQDRFRRTALCNIPDAARAACCSAADVVRLVLEGKLITAAAPRIRGYMGILVDPKAVQAAVPRPESAGVSLRAAVREIGTAEAVLNALIEHGHLPSFTGINPVNRCPQRLIAPGEIRKFNETYVSLFALARDRRVKIGAMRSMLDDAGVKPAFDPATIGARFYPVADLANFL